MIKMIMKTSNQTDNVCVNTIKQAYFIQLSNTELKAQARPENQS